MSKVAETLISKHASSFQKWTQIITEFTDLQIYESDIIPEEETHIWNNLHLMCQEIMESLIEASKIKDTWNSLPSIPIDVNGGLQVTYQSNIIKSNYNFGFDPDGFFLETDLNNTEGIRKMDDTFWFKLAELSQLGKLEYYIRRVPESGEIR